jgi:hypothetical protein
VLAAVLRSEEAVDIVLYPSPTDEACVLGFSARSTGIGARRRSFSVSGALLPR